MGRGRRAAAFVLACGLSPFVCAADAGPEVKRPAGQEVEALGHCAVGARVLVASHVALRDAVLAAATCRPGPLEADCRKARRAEAEAGFEAVGNAAEALAVAHQDLAFGLDLGGACLESRDRSPNCSSLWPAEVESRRARALAAAKELERQAKIVSAAKP